MADLSWLADQAKSLHLMFEQMFYGLALVLLLIGVAAEYFKIAVGGLPAFSPLIGRLLIAAILLNSYPEVSNLIADLTDAIATQIGSLDTIHLVLSKYWDKLQHLHASWTSLKDSVLMLISFVTFFLLYISVYIADAAITYVWVILYVFSPILIALYVLPVTAGATKSLYRALFEVGAWKIVWSALATLLWSAALSQINQQTDINFITAVSFNLILAASLLLTPFVVKALVGAGITSLAAESSGLAAGAAAFGPGSLLTRNAKNKLGRPKQTARSGGATGTSNFQDRYMQSNPVSKARRSGSEKSAAKSPSKADSSQQKFRSSSHSPTVSFKEAAANFQPPVNRSSVKKQPVQRALFVESREASQNKSK